jgi:hypothetical protein
VIAPCCDCVVMAYSSPETISALLELVYIDLPCVGM